MARRSFKVSKRGVDPIEVSIDLPENLNDPLWNGIVSNPDEDINDLALQQFVVKAQAGARNLLDRGAEAVQRFVDGYKYGARSGGFTPTISTEDAAAHGFTEEQLAFLRAAGMGVPGDESDSEGEDQTDPVETPTEGIQETAEA